MGSDVKPYSRVYVKRTMRPKRQLVQVRCVVPIDKIEWRISTLLALILISGEKQGSSVEGFLTLTNDKKWPRGFRCCLGSYLAVKPGAPWTILVPMGLWGTIENDILIDRVLIDIQISLGLHFCGFPTQKPDCATVTLSVCQRRIVQQMVAIMSPLNWNDRR